MSATGASPPRAGCAADRPSFVEGIVRGYRNTLLTSQNYSNLTQCETIDGAPAPLCRRGRAS